MEYVLGRINAQSPCALNSRLQSELNCKTQVYCTNHWENNPSPQATSQHIWWHTGRSGRQIYSEEETRLIIRRSNFISNHKKKVMLQLQTPAFPPDSAPDCSKRATEIMFPLSKRKKKHSQFSWLKTTSFRNKTEKKKKETSVMTEDYWFRPQNQER